MVTLTPAAPLAAELPSVSLVSRRGTETAVKFVARR